MPKIHPHSTKTLVSSRDAWTNQNSIHLPKRRKIPRSMVQGAECRVWGALAIVLRISRCFGVAPLRFVKRRDGLYVSMLPIMRIYNYLLLFGFNVYFLCKIILDFVGKQGLFGATQSKASKMISVANVVLVVILTSTTVFTASARMKTMISYLSKINSIIFKLNYGYPLPPEKKKYALIILSLTGFLIPFQQLAQNLTLYDEHNMYITTEFLKSFAFNSYYFAAILMANQFIFVGLLIHMAMSLLNRDLANTIHSINVKNLETKTLLKKIHKLALSYFEICKVLDETDGSNGILIILLLFHTSIFLVTAPYYIIQHFNLADVRFSLGVIEYGTIALFNFFIIVAIVEPGHMINDEVGNTRLLISNLTRRVSSLDDPLFTEVDMFSKQITLNKSAYSPLGMCELTRPLIATIIGTCTTYLVIILQFQQG